MPLHAIYLDHHATTPVDPRVVSAMLPYFTSTFGNASSRSHRFGWQAEEGVEQARALIASLIGAASKEIVFTSGGTEADNLAIKGVAHAYRDKGNHIITQKTEHKAVLDSCRRLEREGMRISYLDVDAQGRLDPDDVRRAIVPETILVSVMHCNNEVGTVQAVSEIGRIAHDQSVLVHCDAVQGAGLIDFDVARMNVDLATLSAHKMYGPKGVGALYVRRSAPRVHLIAEMDGGGHERGMRSGTLNVPGIVGFGRAAEIMRAEGPENADHERALRKRLERRVFEELDGVTLNGAPEPHRHPGNLHVSFAEVEGEALMIAMKDVALSSGSACTSASLEPSYVLRAMGVSPERAAASLRFGIGRTNTAEEIDIVADTLITQVRRIRALSAGPSITTSGAPPHRETTP